MSGELSISARLIFDKSSATVRASDGISVDVAGDAYTKQVQSIPTSNTALDAGAAIGTQGYIYIKNLDGTNFVSVGITGSYSIKLLAGEFALFRAAAAIFALADTASCLVEYIIIEL